MTMNDDWLDDFCNEEDENGMKGCMVGFGYIIIFWLMLGLCVLCSGCKHTEYVTVPEYHTDTLIITKHQRDSIFVKDSTNVNQYQRGDTVYIKITRWRTEFQDRAVHDTTYIATHDTIPEPYPVEVKVQRELSWWQKTLQRIGGIALGLLLLWLGWQIWKIYKRRF